MANSYVEEITNAWFKTKGFLVTKNVWFQKSGPKRSWTDIDVLAFKPGELVICSCKAFLGNKKAERAAADLKKWFDEAEDFITRDFRHQHLKEGARLIKLIVVDTPGSKKIFNEVKLYGIEIIQLRSCYKEIISNIIEGWRKSNPHYAKEGKFWLKSPQMSWGKEEGMVERLTIALLAWDYLKEDLVKGI